MRLIERYLLRQLLGPTLLATAALSMVAMLSAVLGNLDVISQGQSPLILIKISLLAMPQLLALILPIALFVAALVSLNRVHTEQEIAVCFASGMSTWRVDLLPRCAWPSAGGLDRACAQSMASAPGGPGHAR